MTSKLNNSAVLWGRLHESVAFENYETLCSSKQQMLSKSGIFIYEKAGYLAASPDGIVSTSDGNKCGSIEIKCPYSCRNMLVRDACHQIKAFCCEVIDNEIQLKKNHNYYYQIQGAMAIAKVDWCDFIVWTTKDMYIERVKFDERFWNKCFSKLTSVYSSFILPEIIYPRIPLNLDIIEYPPHLILSTSSSREP